MEGRKVSGAVIRRLPGYYRYLSRLEDEGVPFGADGRVDMARCRWDGR